MTDRLFRLYCFWKQYGTVAAWRIVRRKYFNRPLPVAWQVAAPLVDRNGPVTPSKLIRSRFEALTPLRAFHPSGTHTRRVSLVTDSINSGSLYGGVATSLFFSALLANRLGATLRIITRTERSRPDNFEHILSACGISLDGEVEFRLAAFYDQSYQIDILPEEIFVTTSWWTTAAALPCVSAPQILYLLQEDERMFYPFGDERLKCEAILRNTEIRFLVNTKLLYEYFLEEGFGNIGSRGAWFEPAFPPAVFSPRVTDRQEKKRFLFYARPNNVRNLFYHGLDVIEQAVTQGVLNPDIWEIILVGKDIPAFSFSGGTPVRHENLTWSQYAALTGTIDLGLVLMYSPHPSYPPLDLAASGAVVVTNRYANKKDLSGYSPNILCSDLEPDALVDTLRVAVELALDKPARERNFRQNNLRIDWRDTFVEAINFVAGGH
ncbi:MAG: hypothetical protein R6W75_11400 [Smithellaceae bacterium]